MRGAAEDAVAERVEPVDAVGAGVGGEVEDDGQPEAHAVRRRLAGSKSRARRKRTGMMARRNQTLWVQLA